MLSLLLNFVVRVVPCVECYFYYYSHYLSHIIMYPSLCNALKPAYCTHFSILKCYTVFRGFVVVSVLQLLTVVVSRVPYIL
jgi:hypothetical protein